ncbi:Target SNARE coiled-coil homology domain [Dillenia turbinata]|uniref:Target SNARE coiled-coil homology domain n=1 Tax=Dillenia turbinata TaxID=194707 RepID=A0AAN8VPZ6_9MAGN
MTKSFLSYVDLKKQAMKDLEEPDIEMGQLNHQEEQNLSLFFEEVSGIKSDMEEITNLLLDLQDLNEQSKSTLSAKVLRGLKDRINSDMVNILRKAKMIKAKLESLDRSNKANRSISNAYKEGSPIDRTRMSVTNGLRVKLRDMMNDFQSLREQMGKDHKEAMKRRYYNATGEEPSEEMVEKMIYGQVEIEGEGDFVKETKERNEAVKDIQKSLTELHQVFLDMAVMVETQGEKMETIEQNMNSAGAYVSDGTKELVKAKKLKDQRRKWACLIGGLLLVLLLICLIWTFSS